MWFDLLIIAGVGFAIYRGYKIGFIRQLCSTAGFFAGLFFGAWLQPHIITLGHSADSRAALTVVSILGSGLILLTIGEYLGVYLKNHVKPRHINLADNGLGSVLSVISVLVAAWLIGSVFNHSSIDALQTGVRDSRIIGQLNHRLPPAPAVVGQLGRLINPNGFPDVFIGNEPIPRGDVDLPALGDLAAAVNKDKDSVVRIKGQGCGGIVSGSGFVVGQDLVATNAHVVAGIQKPYVQDVNGSHQSQVIWFDPDLDFAVLRATGLVGQSLAFSSQAATPGTPAAVLGYPAGGDFSAKPAAVLDEITARGRDIYGSAHTLRAIYEVRADITHGNSGGPLVGKDGSVIGIIFAEYTTYNDVGYVLTNDKVISAVLQAASRTRAVNPGPCIT